MQNSKLFFCIAILSFSLALGPPAFSQTDDAWPDPGPPATRDLFPLNLTPLTYRPVGARVLGRGNTRISLQVTDSNTFEFSQIIKNQLARNTEGRILIDVAGVHAYAQAHREEPLIYYFDTEIERTELRIRHGLTSSTDVEMNLSWVSINGGFLDSAIEGFHKLGFKQIGRLGVAKDQNVLTVIQYGEVVIFSQESTRSRPVDPVLTLVQRIHEDPKLTVSLVGMLQLPLTKWKGVYQSKWDSSIGLASELRISSRQALNGEVAYLRRALKKGGPDAFLIKDQLAAHLGWEWRGWRWGRPFFVLVATNGITSHGPGSKLDQPTLVHDLGIHFRLRARGTVTLSYINNISHNENTADMGIALRLSVKL